MKKKYCSKQEEIKKSALAKSRKSLREDSLDDPDIDLSQAFKGRDLEILENYQRGTLRWLEEIVSYELESRGFKKVRFFSKDGYKLYSGGVFTKKVAEPGSRILLTIEIGEFGKIEANGISYNAEDLADIIIKAIDDKTVRIDAVYKAGNSGIDSAQWKIRLCHEVPEDLLSMYKSQDSKEDQARDNLTESSSNDKLNSDEKSIVEEIIQADFESGLTGNDHESVLDMFKEDDVLSDKAEAATEYYFELLEYGPAGILEVITDNWSDDYLAEYGEFDDEDCDSDDEDCGDWETEKSVDINLTADWYKVSQIEGLMYMHKGMTAEEAKEVLGIDPSYVYVPSGNLEK